MTQLPLSGAFLGSRFAVPAARSRERDIEFSADLRGVTAGYFQTMAVRTVAGRGFSAHDGPGSPAVAIVDETLARRFWPAGDAVGGRLRWIRTGESVEIVGVVASVRHYGLAAPPRETVYRPYEQYAAMPEMFVQVRSTRGFDEARSALIEEVRRLDPNQAVADIERVDTLVQNALGQPRFSTRLLMIFAALSVLLASIGIYGIVSLAVVERTHEIGVRMALGAEPERIARMIVGDSVRMAMAGLPLGIGSALLLAPLACALLFDVSPWDVQIFAGTVAFSTAVALTASYLPARRAARLDPAAALRR